MTAGVTRGVRGKVEAGPGVCPLRIHPGTRGSTVRAVGLTVRFSDCAVPAAEVSLPGDGQKAGGSGAWIPISSAGDRLLE